MSKHLQQFDVRFNSESPGADVAVRTLPLDVNIALVLVLVLVIIPTISGVALIT